MVTEQAGSPGFLMRDGGGGRELRRLGVTSRPSQFRVPLKQNGVWIVQEEISVHDLGLFHDASQLLDDVVVEDVHVLDGLEQTQLVQGQQPWRPHGPRSPLDRGCHFCCKSRLLSLLPLLFLLLPVSFHVCVSAFDLEEDSTREEKAARETQT